MARTAVIGAGAWGTALARLLSENGHDCILWSHKEKTIRMLKETHSLDKLPGVLLPENLSFTCDLKEAMTGRDLIVMAVASPGTRETACEMKEFLKKGQKIVTVTKGIEDGTLMTQTDILEELLPDAVYAVLSGPSHAEEVVRGLPTSVVAASKARLLAEYVQNIFMSPVFRVYASPDVLGVELGGSLKNVIALAAGMADGMGFGDNCKAALITRGIHEITGLALKMGAFDDTLYGLSGIGDLVVTCASMHSRNRRAGILVGQGKSMNEAMDEVGQVVEGVYSARAALRLSEKYKAEMPIIREVNKVLFDGKDPKAAVEDLMLRDKKIEIRIQENELPESWKSGAKA